jgi:hypothetical protein
MTKAAKLAKDESRRHDCVTMLVTTVAVAAARVH